MSKKAVSGYPVKRKEILTDNWKALFLVFCVFTFSFLVFFVFFCCCFLFCFVFVLFLFVLGGGFKGQVRWPKGPPHLALNLPYLSIFVFVFVFFSFSFFAFNRQKNPVFPPKKGHLFIFNVSLFFSLNLFWPPPFSVSLSLSLSFSCFFFSFLCFFLFSLCFLFLSLFHFSFFFAFVS